MVRRVAMLVGVAALAIAPPAAAQDAAKAQAVLAEGSQLETEGRLASAARAFRRGADRADAAGDAKLAAVARARADETLRRASMLVLALPATIADGLELRLDDAPIDRAAWTTPQPVDGGRHRVLARAPGRREWSIDVTVANEGESAQVVVPDLLPAPPPPALVDAPPPSSPAAAPPSPPPFWNAPRIAGAALAGVGVVAAGAGAYFGLQATNRWSARNAECDNDLCTDAGEALAAGARASADRATIAFVVAGGALAAGAVTFFYFGPRASAPSAAIGATPVAGGATIGVRGTF